MTSESIVKLYYFNARGLAEISRILLAIARVDYEDIRFPIEAIDVHNHIYKRDEFEEARKSGLLDKSMGKVPLLEIYEKGEKFSIPQSKAIERYISKRWGLMGQNLNEEARIDAICECVKDIKEDYQKIRHNSDNSTYFLNLHKDFKNLEKALDENTSYAIGNKLSLADVYIYYLVTQFYDNKKVLDIAGHIPRIRDIVTKVASRPEVRVWIMGRPKTSF